MDQEYITGLGVYRGFLAGYYQVLEKRDYLNRINLFPVPDGDTGTNLASTFSSIADSLRVERSVHNVFTTMAEAALEGARGNSGIIIAQFINGLRKETQGHARITARQFSHAVLKASEVTYAAVAEPVEGTILTVIKDWALSLVHLSSKVQGLEDLFKESFLHAKKSLEKTKSLLEVHRKAGVEDAGASGFVSFLEGLNSFILDGIIPKRLRRTSTLDIQGEKALHPTETLDSIQHRYCTEALLEVPEENIEALRRILEPYGDSLITTSCENLTRIHLHTNSPADLFLALQDEGTIKKQKVDDMVLEYRTAKGEHPSVAIVTDSIADLPKELKDQYLVHMISQQVLWGKNRYLDRVTITPETFYPYLDSGSEYPTSSLPEERNMENLLSLLSSYYTSAVVLPVGSKLSGTKALFDKVKERVEREDFKISVVDTKMNSAAQGLLVLTAAEAAWQGKGFEEIMELLEGEIKKIRILVAVSTFKYMIKSGRVGPLKGKIATLLNLKPIVSLDEEGKGIAFGKAFSQKALQNKVVKIIEKYNQERRIKRYVVVHAAAGKKAEAFARKIEGILKFPPRYIMEISPVVGLHAGVGSVAVAFQWE